MADNFSHLAQNKKKYTEKKQKLDMADESMLYTYHVT